MNSSSRNLLLTILFLAAPAIGLAQPTEPPPPRPTPPPQSEEEMPPMPPGEGALFFGREPIARGYLGVDLEDMTPELRSYFGAPRDAGILVESVHADSPADKAGVQVGDVLTAIDGKRIDSVSSAVRMVRAKKSGESAALEVVRGHRARTLSVSVGQRDIEEIDVGRLLRDRGLRGRPLVLDESADKAFQRLDHVLSSPAWKARIDNLDECGRLRGRVDDLEKRLKDLEKKLATK
jgi:membrane-associated protease RseP (regulator of RpoE activity)